MLITLTKHVLVKGTLRVLPTILLIKCRLFHLFTFPPKREAMWGFLGDSVGKEPACNAGGCLKYRRAGFNPWVGKFPWRRKWQPTPVFLPGKSHGQRSLAGYSPWGRESQTQLSD